MIRKATLIRAIACASLVLLVGGIAAAQELSVEIRSGTVLAVNGNELVVRGPLGVRAFTVPEGFVFNMDDKKLTIDDLKPGMPISAVIKTTKTPVPMTATEVKEGTVIHTIGSALVVKMSDGEMRKFSSKELESQDLIIIRNGKQISPYDLKKGDTFSATIVTELPPQTVTDTELAVFVDQPPTPRPAAVAQAAPQPTPPPPAPRPATLPKTASRLPWILLAGLVSLAVGAGLMIRRFLVAG